MIQHSRRILLMTVIVSTVVTTLSNTGAARWVALIVGLGMIAGATYLVRRPA